MPRKRVYSEADKASHRKYYSRNAERLKAAAKQWRAKQKTDRPGEKNEKNKEYRKRLKLETLTRYGPSGQLCCSWADCHVSDIDMLSLDHINNDGARQRREAKGSGDGAHLYSKLKTSGYPDGYQTLCLNHQFKKELLRKMVR